MPARGARHATAHSAPNSSGGEKLYFSLIFCSSGCPRPASAAARPPRQRGGPGGRRAARAARAARAGPARAGGRRGSPDVTRWRPATSGAARCGGCWPRPGRRPGRGCCPAQRTSAARGLGRTVAMLVEPRECRQAAAGLLAAALRAAARPSQQSSAMDAMYRAARGGSRCARPYGCECPG